MLGNYFIGLREGLEAALVVSILVAYLVKSGRRHLLPHIWSGVALAAAVSLAFGASLEFGPAGLSHQSQELVGGVLSLLAVGFVTWMIFWMARAARSISGELRSRVDAAADAGRLSLSMVALLAVGREGLETSLFLWAATHATTASAGGGAAPLAGAGLGIATACVAGYLLYRGAIRINLTRFFTWTGAFLMLIAAGVLAYGIHDLQEAGVLPGEGSTAFDVSGAIEPGGAAATLLKGVFNFSPSMSWLSTVGWLGYVGVIGSLFVRMSRRRTGGTAAPTSTVQASGERVRSGR
jgi:high-affinity iron transporter